ncbi:hypothetical protein GBAR_LOCUS14556, partial [Geodia barretti]
VSQYTHFNWLACVLLLICTRSNLAVCAVLRGPCRAFIVCPPGYSYHCSLITEACLRNHPTICATT